MKVLVTAGNTRVPIDKVRGIDNVFKGRTGAAIAEYFSLKNCEVTLLTSHPELVSGNFVEENGLTVIRYKTYDDLMEKMGALITSGEFDIIIHSAAVSDYRVEGMYVEDFKMKGQDRVLYGFNEVDSSGKIGSSHPSLWMKLVPTEKIVDKIRQPWGFKGILVKFKLQVDMPDTELIAIATESMEHSDADFIVANTLEGMDTKAFIIPAKRHGGEMVHTSRLHLPLTLFKAIGL